MLDPKVYNAKKFIFGLAKAKAIVDNIEEIKKCTNDPMRAYNYEGGVNIPFYDSTFHVPFYFCSKIVIHFDEIKYFVESRGTRTESAEEYARKQAIRDNFYNEMNQVPVNA